MTRETKQRLEIAQMNRTIQQMQNELTRLWRAKNVVPMDQNPRVPTQEQRKIPNQEKRVGNDGRNDEQRPRAP
jgi:hypothetical protein